LEKERTGRVERGGKWWVIQGGLAEHGARTGAGGIQIKYKLLIEQPEEKQAYSLLVCMCVCVCMCECECVARVVVGKGINRKLAVNWIYMILHPATTTAAATILLVYCY
jgi:hypothetical protein